MALTERFYGANTIGIGRPIQDFGLSDTNALYQYTAKLRVKGLLVIVFFDTNSAPSVKALDIVQGWSTDLPTQKWTALAVTEGERPELAQFASQHNLSNVSVMLDYELYQTRQWGVSHLPSVYLISGKSGRVLNKIMGLDEAALDGMKLMLHDEVSKIVSGEEAAKKAAEEKAAADAAAKAAETPKA